MKKEIIQAEATEFAAFVAFNISFHPAYDEARSSREKSSDTCWRATITYPMVEIKV